MPRFPPLQAIFLLSFLLWESACQKRQVTVPVPAPPATSQPASPALTPAAATSGTSNSGATTPAQEPSPYQVNKPPQAAKKPARSTPSPAPAAASTASPSPAPAAPAPASPAPKLGDILTPDEQKQYTASIDQSLTHARASLNSIAGRQLNQDQQAQVEQIRNFMQQAQKTRATDLAGAKSLAERAEVLARDLAASFH
ncbi:MAG: hypothetical protein ACLPWF_06560 [Bryobacteraceae bacterium]